MHIARKYQRLGYPHETGLRAFYKSVMHCKNSPYLILVIELVNLEMNLNLENIIFPECVQDNQLDCWISCRQIH